MKKKGVRYIKLNNKSYKVSILVKEFDEREMAKEHVKTIMGTDYPDQMI